MLAYLLIVSLYILLFYSCYWLLLRRNTFFALNRAYLVVSVLLSLVLPFVELPTGTTESLPISTLTLPTFVVGAQSQSNHLTLIQWIWILYTIGVTGKLIHLGLNLRAVFRLIGRGSIVHKSTYTLVNLPDDATPSFSFGRYLVLNYTDARSEPDALLRHEEAHIRQYHTIDVLFLEIIQAIFWFNPVLILHKRALQEVHEFLADRAVLKTPQPDYPQQLVAYTLNVSPSTLITPFVSKSTLKQRIVMLQKPASHRRALLSYVLVLPLAACLVMCTQSEQDQPVSAQDASRKAIKVQGDVFTVVEHQPEFPGGMARLGEFLGENLKYPEKAQRAQVEGKVFVSFVVTKNGDIADVKLVKGIGFGADEEAIRVVSQMPNWIPGKQDGQVVNVRYNLPIRFQLEESEPANAKKLGVPPPPPPVPAEKKLGFFTVPTDDAEILLSYKHFIVDGEEVAFEDFIRYNKANIVEASSSEQSIRIKTN